MRCCFTSLPELFMNFEQTVVHCCAPVLCGIKPASIFSMCIDIYGKGSEKLSEWKNVFGGRNIFIVPIQKKGGRMLFFVYNRQLLSSVLENPKISDYLIKKNYPVQDGFDAVLYELLFRLMRDYEFPHEIGLFLGYPLEDVVAFEQNDGAFFKYSGSWKVYGDIKNARQKMKLYKICCEYCMKLVAEGMSVPSAAENYRCFRNKLEV